MLATVAVCKQFDGESFKIYIVYHKTHPRQKACRVSPDTHYHRTHLSQTTCKVWPETHHHRTQHEACKFTSNPTCYITIMHMYTLCIHVYETVTAKISWQNAQARIVLNTNAGSKFCNAGRQCTYVYVHVRKKSLANTTHAFHNASPRIHSPQTSMQQLTGDSVHACTCKLNPLQPFSSFPLFHYLGNNRKPTYTTCSINRNGQT